MELIKLLKKYCIWSEIDYYHDDPYFFVYKARVKGKRSKINNGTGTSFNQQLALLRALGEAIERYSLFSNDKLIIFEKYSNIKNRSLNLLSFPKISHNNKLLNKFKNTTIGWTKGFKLKQFDEKSDKLITEECLIPAHLVYVPYTESSKDLYLQQPLSTGTAFRKNIKEAILTGILEVIERDCFIRSFYKQMGISKLKLEKIKDHDIIFILNELNRCFLEYFFINISLFPNIYVILCIIIDKTRNQPLLVSGLGTSFDLKYALIKSVEEAMQLRPWLRDEFRRNNIHKTSSRKIKTYLQRVAYWNYGRSISWIKKNLKFYLDLQTKIIQDAQLENSLFKNSNHKLKNLLTTLNKMNIEIYFTDITPNLISKHNFKVIKVIIPKMQPFFLDEEFKYLTNNKFNNKNKFYNNPHFFI